MIVKDLIIYEIHYGRVVGLFFASNDYILIKTGGKKERVNFPMRIQDYVRVFITSRLPPRE